MNFTTRMVCSLALSAAGLSAQAPAKSQPAKTQPALLTDQEKNIRAYIELLRSDTRKDKAQIMGTVMRLDADHAAKFWPIYKEFQGEYTKIGDGIVGLIKRYADNYDNMTDQVADQLATRVLDLEQERNALKRKYYQRFKQAIDSFVAARFLQVENQLERVIDLQVASELPVIEAR